MPLSENTIIALSTLLFILIVLLIFKDKFYQSEHLTFNLPGVQIKASGKDLARSFEKLFKKLLRESHVEFYQALLKYDTPPTVREAIPGFNRESEEWIKSKAGIETIGMLRALRGLGFIEPLEGKKWTADKHILITDFGKDMAKYLK